MGEKYKDKRYVQLTQQQRGYITRLSRELKSVIQNPANFVIRRVKSADTLKGLKAQGYKVVNDHAIIKSDFDAPVKIVTRKSKGGSVAVHVKIGNKFEEKTSYKLKIQTLVANEIVPGWIRSMEANFVYGDNWACSIAGKPIGDFFQSIDTLLFYFEDYLEKELGDDAAKCVLMHIKNLTPTTNENRSPRTKEIKAANFEARKNVTFRY